MGFLPRLLSRCFCPRAVRLRNRRRRAAHRQSRLRTPIKPLPQHPPPSRPNLPSPMPLGRQNRGDRPHLRPPQHRPHPPHNRPTLRRRPPVHRHLPLPLPRLMQHPPSPPKHRRRRRPRARHLHLLLRKARLHPQLRRLRLPARPRRVAAQQRQPPQHPHPLPPPRRQRPLRRRQSTIRSRNNCAGFRAASSTALSAASRNAPQLRRSIRAARYAPIWLTDGHANARAQAAIGYLSHVDADGLNPADYRSRISTSLSDPAALAEAEMKFSVAVMTYARHASIGRDRLVAGSANIYYETESARPAAVLATWRAPRTWRPCLMPTSRTMPGYLALKAKLAEIRAGKTRRRQGADPGRAGAQDRRAGSTRVPQLRERLGLSGDGDDLRQGARRSGEEIPEGARAQGDRHADGADDRSDQWPRARPCRSTSSSPTWSAGAGCRTISAATYVMVNLPDFTLRVFNDGKRIWKTKIVIGKPTSRRRS